MKYALISLVSLQLWASYFKDYLNFYIFNYFIFIDLFAPKLIMMIFTVNLQSCFLQVYHLIILLKYIIIKYVIYLFLIRTSPLPVYCHIFISSLTTSTRVYYLPLVSFIYILLISSLSPSLLPPLSLQHSLLPSLPYVHILLPKSEQLTIKIRKKSYYYSIFYFPSTQG